MNFLIILLILAMLNNCTKKGIGDDKLSLKRIPYYGNDLKIDGYYYSKVGNEIFDTYFFYRNGVILSGGGNAPNTSPFNYVEKSFISISWQNSIKGDKIAWGIFQINGNQIQFERWYPSSGLLPSYIRSGIILNDTTFLINKVIRSNGKEEEAINETYNFRKFSPKPDSTNSFVQ